SHVDVARIVVFTYVAGAACFLLSLAVSLLRLFRLRASADVSVRGTKLANELAAAEGIRTRVEVFTSARLAVPMTFGWHHPAILLPEETRDWDAVAIERALRHELEHVVRRDWLTQIVSRVACALYWPHPEAWMLWSRLRLEAERACDDAVIRSGSGGEHYAEQLVDLARRVGSHGTVPALAMATRSNLGRRVESILDASRVRTRLGASTSVAVGVVAIASLLGIAPLRLVAGPIDRAMSNDAEGNADRDPLDFALLKVARSGDGSAVRSLLERGARPDVAFRGDGTALIEAARSGSVDALAALVDAGADVNRGVRGDGNPLIAAASRGHVEAVQFLLDHGADVDEGIPGDGNALIMAAGANELETVKLLIARGASIEKEVPGDENALIHAAEGGAANVVRYLIARGANVNARIWADHGDSGGEWRTPLVMARRRGSDEVVRILIAAGAKE
ncbi:MAG TPA: M56 family metallopeptidase, partial [Thermoanaerobaculia bacterium]|nr:M56 family metallopeptidase [Thermoanaerobaculia bacterium]